MLTAEGVDRDEHMRNVRLLLAGSVLLAHVDLLVEEARLEVLVDGLVGDSAEEGHVLHAGRLLLPEALGPVGLE
jgi:hypothetical protein